MMVRRDPAADSQRFHINRLQIFAPCVGCLTKGSPPACQDGSRPGKGRREYGFSPERPSAVFVLGHMGHWNGDRDCEPAQLTGCLLGGQASSLPSTEHGTPLWLSTLSEAGF